MLCPPALLIVEAIATEGRVAGFGGDPDDDIAIITGGSQGFAWGFDLSEACRLVCLGGEQGSTFRGPSNNVDSLGVLGEGGQVLDLPVFTIFLDLPELHKVSQSLRVLRSLVLLLAVVMVADRGCFCVLGVGSVL